MEIDSQSSSDMDAIHRHAALQRMESLHLVPGKEGSPVMQDSYAGKSLAVFTSGGDSQGMNAAVRAIVRMGLYLGCRVYTIKEGYQGMVDGGDKNIVEANWSSVSGIIELGGTIIGSARCMEFMERPGRLRAAKNLVKRQITNLVCIGGDGSLTGANLFREEWSSLLDELVANEEITDDEAENCNHLNIVGLVGSIDNDFCGTDMTIGTDTALHRIIEAVDAISVTAASHQRCFVLEVMGRHCGYLALVAAIATEADYVLIPECPPDIGWEEKLCTKLHDERHIGQRLNIILVAEGATDKAGNPISVSYVKDLISKRLNYDTRITVLGHVQRGGNTSAFDRILASRMGAESVLALMEATPETAASVIVLDGNMIVRKQLVECVKKTKKVAEAMKRHDYDACIAARGRSFVNNLAIYRVLSKLQPPNVDPSVIKEREPLTLAIVMVGAPACGANAAARSFVRRAIVEGVKVVGVYDSLQGLAHGHVQELSWSGVSGWSGKGGSRLGTKRALPEDIGLEALADNLRNFKVSGLLIIGGFEAYASALQFVKARSEYPAFCIPLVVIPSTISNNVPGTDFSLGCDTSLNEISKICDLIKLSAAGSKRRTFIIETMGGYCGYLATLAGLAGGADAAYIYEEPFTCNDLQKDCLHLVKKTQDSEVKRGLILVNEKANSNMDSNFIYRLYSEVGKDAFTTRINTLGHAQQGGTSSPFDRNMGTKMGMKAASYLIEQTLENDLERPVGAPDATVMPVYTTSKQSSALLGVICRQTIFTPLLDLEADTDFQHRLPKKQWWLRLRVLLRILAKHIETEVYSSEVQDSAASSANMSRQSSFAHLSRAYAPHIPFKK